MTRRRPITRYAPGKLFIVGEYAVVEPGTPAILAAVDRQVGVTVSAADGVVVASDLCPHETQLQWRSGRLTGRGPDDDERACNSLAHVVSAIEVMGALLAERALPPPALHVSISSRLHDNGTKFGLGSSGAVTVATIAAVAAHYGLDLSPEARFRLALLATARIDTKASGGDLAASTWGGWIAYQAPDRAAVLELAHQRGIEDVLRAPWPRFELRQLPPPHGLAMEVGWTGTPASTASLMTDLNKRGWHGSASHRTFLTRTTECVRASVRALERGDGQELLHQIRFARRALAAMDDETRLGVFTGKLTALCDAAEALGGAAKPSGAGGGDCGIAFLDAEALPGRSHLRARWAAAGVLPLPIRPATKGLEP